MSVSAPAAAQGNAAQAARAQAGPMIPFGQASRRAMEQPLTFTFTPGTAPITLGPADLTPNGYLRQTELHVSTVTAGSGNTAADFFPFNIFQNLQFIDTGGQKMDDLPGVHLLLDNIVGGWTLKCDPRGDYDYSSAANSPNFRLRLERELFGDGRGALPNLSGSQKYRIRAVVDAASNIWSTVGTPPTLKVDVVDHLWLLPEAQDGGGHQQQRQPPLLGLAQYRTSFYPAQSITNPQVDFQIKATGNLIKYIQLIARDTTGARNDLVFPDPLTLRQDNSYPFDSVPLAEVITSSMRYLPQATQRDTGVLFLPFDYGTIGRYAGENGVSPWMPTSTATWIEFKGRQATATNGTIDVLVCEISVAEVDPSERAAIGSMTGTWQPAIPQTVPGGV